MGEVAGDQCDQLAGGDVGEIGVDDATRIEQPIDELQIVVMAGVGLELDDRPRVVRHQADAIAVADRGAPDRGRGIAGPVEWGATERALAFHAMNLNGSPCE